MFNILSGSKAEEESLSYLLNPSLQDHPVTRAAASEDMETQKEIEDLVYDSTVLECLYNYV